MFLITFIQSFNCIFRTDNTFKYFLCSSCHLYVICKQNILIFTQNQKSEGNNPPRLKPRSNKFYLGVSKFNLEEFNYFFLFFYPFIFLKEKTFICNHFPPRVNCCLHSFYTFSLSASENRNQPDDWHYYSPQC